MCKRIIVEDARAPSGKMMVITISSDRVEMEAAVRSLAKKEWVGRVMFYEGVGRGGIDVYVEGLPIPNGSGTQHAYRVYSSVPSQPWGEPVTVARSELSGFVETLFQKHGIRQRARQDDAEELGVAAPVPRPPSFATATCVPRQIPGQQMSFL